MTDLGRRRATEMDHLPMGHVRGAKAAPVAEQAQAHLLQIFYPKSLDWITPTRRPTERLPQLIQISKNDSESRFFYPPLYRGRYGIGLTPIVKVSLGALFSMGFFQRGCEGRNRHSDAYDQAPGFVH